MSTSRPSRRPARPYHHGNLRSALLAEAVCVLAEADVASLSLRELARRLGVSHAAPYRHFADKDALLAAIAQQGFDLLAAEVEAAAAQHPEEPSHQLADTGWAYVRFALHQPQHFQVMFGRGTPPQTSQPELLVAGQHAFGSLLRVIETGQRIGRLVSGEPRELAVAAWSQVHGLATLLLDGQLAVADDAECEALVRRCAQIQYGGLGRRGRLASAGVRAAEGS
jgi:AcrR family transcriptional regulator